MDDSFSRAGVRHRPRVPKRTLCILFLLALPAAALFIEHWRGERALRAWKSEMAARGELLDPDQIWPAPEPASRVFAERLAEAVDRLPRSLDPFAGVSGSLSFDESGRPCRASQQTRPALAGQPGGRSTWQDFGAAIKEARPALESLRELMKNPPRATDMKVTTLRLFDPIPNHVNARRSCQALRAAVISDLHQRNLEGALENLEALRRCARGYYADDPILVTLMIRVAILGLGNGATWDALQDDGWTEPQLLRLQNSSQTNALFPQILRALAAERVARMATMDWFASHDYREWVERFEPIFSGFGSKPADLDTTNWRGHWRRWIFHPAWSYAWRTQDELDYVQHSQQGMDIVREAVRSGSWVHMREQQAVLRRDYRLPIAAWRFYLALPLLDQMSEIIGSRRGEETECPYTDFSMAWFIAARAFTIHEMANTVIALKRYRLREGRMPEDLASLVPGFLGALPRDLMDGQPLCYRLNADGTFVLYSVGENAQDDGGDSRSAFPASPQTGSDTWPGRDWVWPQVAAEGRSPGR